MLQLYANLYEFQLKNSNKYSVIDVNELALITEKVFTWYKDADKQQKKFFANLLFALQTKSLAKPFLSQLGDIKSKSATEQLPNLQECLNIYEA
ncbi:hypothetical protein [Legionella tucsonensis]|uniref:Uncharacterized protein n=1 Tax=Legionella tucsonensis TaxID=40335 RepID=A0A0W0ZWS8_9GAMM|nr:hypothetical protein [Legionella tucsonensis]KTD73203.1 hypothetical protein Ltuc_1050 [Legionella tucsonensis]